MKLLASICICAGTAIPVIAQAANKTAKYVTKPNVIYILYDDLGYGDFGCYGQQKIRTPHVDRLAQEGIRFTRHYTAFPISAPARCALLTGKHAGHSFVRDNYEMGGFSDEREGGQMPLPEGTVTVGRMMQQNGYVTGTIGKWSLGFWDTSGNPNKQGFDYFYGFIDQTQPHNYYPTHLWEDGKYVELNNARYVLNRPIPKDSPDEVFHKLKGNDYAIDKLADKTMQFITDNKNKPFFLYLPVATPHLPLQAPIDAVKEYEGAFPEQQKYYGDKGYAPNLTPYSTYAAMITYTDKMIGRIVDLLKQLKLDKNTIIMVSSDNGCSWSAGGYDPEYFNSSAGLRGSKGSLNEGGIAIPFVAYCPALIPGGRTTDLLSAHYDLFATMADMVGDKNNYTTDGISFLPTLIGKTDKQKKHDYLYFEFTWNGGDVAIVTDRWKGIKNYNKKSTDHPWQIYDLLADRAETTDIADQKQDMIPFFDSAVKAEHLRPTLREWEFINPK